MKNFMSAVYIKPNSISDEKICVGLFVGGTQGTQFAVSENKLKVVNQLLPKEVYLSLKKSLETLNNGITDTASREHSILFSDKVFTPEYFSYLNKYSKGMLSFAEPATIGKSITSDEFEKLFELYVGEKLHKEVKAPAKITLKKIVAGYLKSETFKAKADIDFKINNTIISSIYTERTVDFISCNGNIFAGKSIDFNVEAKTIENHLFEYRVLVEGLLQFAERRKLTGKPKFLVYHNEPETIQGKDVLYKAAKDREKHFELAAVDDLSKAEATLNKHTYRKFSEVI